MTGKLFPFNCNRCTPLSIVKLDLADEKAFESLLDSNARLRNVDISAGHYFRLSLGFLPRQFYRKSWSIQGMTARRRTEIRSLPNV